MFYVCGFFGENFLDCYKTCNTREEAEKVLNELFADNESDEEFGIYTDKVWESAAH